MYWKNIVETTIHFEYKQFPQDLLRKIKDFYQEEEYYFNEISSVNFCIIIKALEATEIKSPNLMYILQ